MDGVSVAGDKPVREVAVGVRAGGGLREEDRQERRITLATNDPTPDAGRAQPVPRVNSTIRGGRDVFAFVFAESLASAEREGFEPSRQVNPAHAISSRAP